MPYKDFAKEKANRKLRGRFYYMRNRKKSSYKAMMKRINAKFRKQENPAYIRYLKHSYAVRRLKDFLKGGRVLKDYITIVCQCCDQEHVAPFKQSELSEKMQYLILFRELLEKKHETAQLGRSR